MIRRRSVALAVLALLAGPAADVLASGLSQRLTSRGLEAFHEDRYQAALEEFERAVAADPKDPQARYYRGVTRGHLGDYDGAAADLERAVEIDPTLDQGYLELGYARLRARDHAGAVDPLSRAAEVDGLAPQATLLLGVAALRLGRYDSARANLERAESLAPDLGSKSRYYRGIVAYRSGSIAEARRHFERVIEADPDSDEASEARVFLDRLRREAPKPWQVWAGIAYQYDSNVTLEPDDFAPVDPGGVSDESDGRISINAGGEYVAVSTANTRIAASYDFSQSLHFDLSNYDLQNHRVGGEVTRYADHFHYGLAGYYDHYFRDGDEFLRQVTALPWVRIPLGAAGSTEIYYRMKVRDFDDDYSDGIYDELRDSNNHAVGIRHRIDGHVGDNDLYLAVGYRFDHDDAAHDAGRQFQYDGHMGEVAAGIHIGPRLGIEAGYAYKRENYEDVPSNGRHDDEQHFLFEVRRSINDFVALSAAYIGRLNDSNDPNFEYDRHIGSIALELRY